jgi:hypothetical protein
MQEVAMSQSAKNTPVSRGNVLLRAMGFAAMAGLALGLCIGIGHIL